MTSMPHQDTKFDLPSTIATSRHRVLLVSVTPFWGGGEVYFVKLVKLLAERYDVRAIAVDAEAVRRLKSLPCEVVEVPDGARRSTIQRYLQVARILLQQLLAYKPDVVQLNGQGESYLAALPWLLRVPIAGTRHVPFNENIRGVRRLLAAANLRGMQRVVCVTEVLRSQLAAFLPAERLVVIPNWLDKVPPPPAPNVTLHTPFRVLFVGRLERIKGMLELIRAVQMLQDVQLDVVGTGSLLEECQQAAAEVPHAAIHFHGFQTDCSPFYRAADLLVFPSHPDLEGQGQVPFEAMAHGLPCLVSNIPVALETTANGACAETFTWGDATALASKIADLQHNPERLQALRVAGLQRFHACYTVDAVRDLYFNLFDSLLKGVSVASSDRD